jgi:hypothetical protein
MAKMKYVFGYFTALFIIFAFGACDGGRLGDSRAAFATSGVPTGGAQTSALLPERGTQDSDKVNNSYLLSKTQFTLHEPVVLQAQFINNLSQTVSFDLGADYKTRFTFTLEYPSGVKRTFHAAPPEVFTPGKVTLKPGESFSKNLLLNELLDMPLTGKYNLLIELAPSVGLQPGLLTNPRYNVSFEILPRDARELEHVCAELTDRVLNADSYKAATEPAVELAYVNDPIAVPYLKRVLFSGGLASTIVIPGLERIKNAEAVDVLTVATKSKDSDVALLSRQALERMKR